MKASEQMERGKLESEYQASPSLRGCSQEHWALLLKRHPAGEA